MTNADELLPDAAAACNNRWESCCRNCWWASSYRNKRFTKSWMKADARTTGDATNAIIKQMLPLFPDEAAAEQLL
jgi:hypothetical protein